MFADQLPDLDYINNLPGLVCLDGDMNVYFSNSLKSLIRQILTTLSFHSLDQVSNKPTHKCCYIVDWAVIRPEDDIHIESSATDSLESDHYCIK